MSMSCLWGPGSSLRTARETSSPGAQQMCCFPWHVVPGAGPLLYPSRSGIAVLLGSEMLSLASNNIQYEIHPTDFLSAGARKIDWPKNRGLPTKGRLDHQAKQSLQPQFHFVRLYTIHPSWSNVKMGSNAKHHAESIFELRISGVAVSWSSLPVQCFQIVPVQSSQSIMHRYI